MGEHQSFYAIIPANVRYDNDLSANAKLLYGEITCLCNKEGYCWATNGYFAKLYGVSKVTVSRWITQLKEKGYIHLDFKIKDETTVEQVRIISIVNTSYQKCYGGLNKNDKPPLNKNVNDNNTSMNNTRDSNMRKSAKVQKDAKYEEMFTIFYNAYPKKKDKTKAFNAFKKLKPTQELLDSILKALEWQKQTTDWQKQGGQYIPYPASYLNGHRWEDEQQVNISEPEDDYDPENRANLWISG